MKNSNFKNNCIAVIDDGVNKSAYDLPVIYSTEIKDDLTKMEYNPDSISHESHGTSCARIINKYAENAKIISIKILNKEWKASREQLVESILWCVKNKIRIINLSLGTSLFNDKKIISEAAYYAYKNNLIIIAAHNNKNIITYPASFSYTIGVKADEETILRDYEYQYIPNAIDGIDFIAFCNHKMEDIYMTNSFSVPLITAKSWEIVHEKPGINFEELKNILIKKSCNYEKKMESAFSGYRPDWFYNPVLINLGNSHPKIIVNENDKIIFKNRKEFKYIYWEKTIGKNRLNDIKNEIYIEKDNVDSVIIIRNENNEKFKPDEIQDIYDYCNKYNLGLIILEDKYYDKNIINIKPTLKMKFWHSACFNLFKDNTFKYEKKDIPIISIFDFSGKRFLSQIINLKKYFSNDGFNPLVVSDSSICVLNEIEYIPTIRNHSNDLYKITELFDPDLIIIAYDMYDKDVKESRFISSDIAIYIDCDNCNFNDHIKYSYFKNYICLTDSDMDIKKKFNIKIFNYYKKGYLDSVYEYIKSLFLCEDNVI